MDKLDRAYEGLAMLKEIGMPISTEQLEHIREMEEEYLEEEVLPLLKEELEPLVNKLQHSFSISINVGHGGVLDVQLIREQLKAMATENMGGQRGSISRSASMGFSVEFPDGEEISYRDAQQTFVETLRKIGWEKAALYTTRTFKGYPLVGKVERKDCDFKCQRYIDGWFVYINMSNEKKMEVISQISEQFDLGLEIRKEDGTIYQLTQQPTGKREYFLLNGKGPYNKRKFVFEAVKLYMENNKTAAFEEIEREFPAELQGNYGVVRKWSWVQEKIRQGFDYDNRYFCNEEDMLTTYNGEKAVVCNQWGTQFHRFIEYVKRHFCWDVRKCL